MYVHDLLQKNAVPVLAVRVHAVLYIHKILQKQIFKSLSGTSANFRLLMSTA